MKIHLNWIKLEQALDSTPLRKRTTDENEEENQYVHVISSIEKTINYFYLSF